MTIFIQFGLARITVKLIECFTLLAFGAFMFAIAIVKIMKTELRALKANEKSKKNMYRTFCEFIWTHANAKQLSG